MVFENKISFVSCLECVDYVPKLTKNEFYAERRLSEILSPAKVFYVEPFERIFYANCKFSMPSWNFVALGVRMKDD